MATVLVDGLRVRTEPTVDSDIVAKYNKGDKILSVDLLIFNEGRYWLRYTGNSGNKRYVCMQDEDEEKYIDLYKDVNFYNLEEEIEDQDEEEDEVEDQDEDDDEDYGTGINGIPKQKDFPVSAIQKYGCCFLCACVKGGLTTFNQCMSCYNWGIISKRLRLDDCYVNCDKEQWAKEISQRYGTQYHGDYCFQYRLGHFYLTKNGREIFNSAGIGYKSY